MYVFPIKNPSEGSFYPTGNYIIRHEEVVSKLTGKTMLACEQFFSSIGTEILIKLCPFYLLRGRREVAD
jgi:hypothetical protein